MIHFRGTNVSGSIATGGGGGGPAYVGGEAAAALTVPLPVGVQIGYLVLVFVTGGVAPVTATPAEWTALAASPLDIGSGTIFEYAYYQIYAGGATSVTFDFTDPSPFTAKLGVSVAYSGVDNTAPIHAEGFDDSGSGTTIDAPGVPVTLDDAVRVFGFASDTEVSFVFPSALSARLTAINGETLALADERLDVPETSADRSVTASGVQRGGSLSVVLTPAEDVSVVAVPEDSRDLYKSILLRKSLPSSFDQRRTSQFAKLTAALGESDNQIGGLFGAANFLGAAEAVGTYFEQPFFVVKETTTQAAAASITALLPVPMPVVDGQLLIAYVAKHSTTGIGAITPPAGWTAVANAGEDVVVAGGGLVQAVYWRVASSEPASYVWSWPEADADSAAVILAYGGCDVTVPVAVDVAALKRTAETILACQRVSTPVAKCVLLAFWSTDLTSVLTLPTSMTSREQSSSGLSQLHVAVAEEAVALPVDTGSRVAVAASAANGLTYMLALRPAEV